MEMAWLVIVNAEVKTKAERSEEIETTGKIEGLKDMTNYGFKM